MKLGPAANPSLRTTLPPDLSFGIIYYLPKKIKYF